MKHVADPGIYTCSSIYSKEVLTFRA